MRSCLNTHYIPTPRTLQKVTWVIHSPSTKDSEAGGFQVWVKPGSYSKTVSKRGSCLAYRRSGPDSLYCQKGRRSPLEFSSSKFSAPSQPSLHVIPNYRVTFLHKQHPHPITVLENRVPCLSLDPCPLRPSLSPNTSASIEQRCFQPTRELDLEGPHSKHTGPSELHPFIKSHGAVSHTALSEAASKQPQLTRLGCLKQRRPAWSQQLLHMLIPIPQSKNVCAGHPCTDTEMMYLDLA